MKKLEGKVALVTGVANKMSMGHAVALRLANEGADVVVVDKYKLPRSASAADKGWGGLDSVVAEIKATGRKAMAVLADINNEQEVDKAVAEAEKKLGKIDILVHCAAIRGPMGVQLLDLPESDWRTVIDVNLTGSFLVSKAVARSMRARGKGGKIVLIASLAGNRGVPGSGAYSASKWGVIGLTKTLAMELAKDKIYVNAINPGHFPTNLRDDTYIEWAKREGITPDEARAKFDQQAVKKVPLGRIGDTKDIADLVVFLVSDQSDYIVGQAIDICGGVGLVQG
jgi:NAD(P)-dependent dehydrogenase (short-subunit alcohol dehydrogenase family)